MTYSSIKPVLALTGITEAELPGQNNVWIHWERI